MALLGPTSIKVAHKMLVKSTPGLGLLGLGLGLLGLGLPGLGPPGLDLPGLGLTCFGLLGLQVYMDYV